VKQAAKVKRTPMCFISGQFRWISVASSVESIQIIELKRLRVDIELILLEIFFSCFLFKDKKAIEKLLRNTKLITKL
jgi:hypothetical protein